MLLCLGSNKSEINENTKFHLLCIVLFLFFAFKDGSVGNDSIAYINFFLNKSSMYGTINNPAFEGDRGFVIFSRLISYISHTEFFFILSYTILALTPVYILFKKYAVSKVNAVCFSFVLYGIYSIYLINFRQVLSVSCIIIAYLLYNKIKNKKYKYCLTIFFAFIAASFHSTAFIVIPIMLLLHIPFHISKRTAYIIILGSYLIFFLSTNILSNIMGVVFEFLNLVDLSRMSTYQNNFDNMSSDVIANISWTSVTAYSLLGLIFVYSLSSLNIENFFEKSFLFSIVAYNLFAQFGLSIRLFYIFVLFGVCAIPQLKGKQMIKWAYILLFVSYIFANYKILAPAVLKGHGASDIIPYTFIFE